MASLNVAFATVVFIRCQPCVESFVTDGTWDVGWIYKSFILCGQLEILERLSNWMGVWYTALWLRAKSLPTLATF